MFLFFDLETTGLNPDVDHILEVAAAFVAERTLETQIVLSGVTEPHPITNPVVLDMHTKSGLIGHPLEWTVEEADITLAQLCRQFGGVVTLAGNSVHFDRMFIRQYMPRLDRSLSHRHLDVSVFATAAPDDWRPTVRESIHRAKDDVYRALALFMIWRKRLWSGR